MQVNPSKYEFSMNAIAIVAENGIDYNMLKDARRSGGFIQIDAWQW
ncbi:MAG: hypothetical protein IPO26_21715 [Saprospiraceae bacterium]|nr:hypothetical protein [Saprospiraceae bacterium]